MASNQRTNQVNDENYGYDNPCLATSVKKLYLNRKMADIHFVFDVNGMRERVPAHKAIMAVNSDPFDAMFFGELSEGNVVEIVDATIDAFKEFLRFFYLDKVQLTMENIADVVKLSRKYLLELAPTICERFLMDSLSIENVCFSFGLAIRYDLNDLNVKCEKMISLNTDAVFQSIGFKECDKFVLNQILKLQSLSYTETDVFHSCMVWVKAASGQEKVTRKIINEQLGDLFYDIRFGSMTLEQFSALLSEVNGDLFSSQEYQEIVRMIASNYCSKTFKKEPRRKPWSKDNLVKCNRDTVSGGTSTYYFQDVESIVFSSNKYILLGEIVCSEMYIKNDEKILLADLLVIESPIGAGNSRIIAQEKITLYGVSNQTISLQRAILVRPQFKYEIQFKQCPGTSYFYASKPLAEFQLPNTDVTIQFQNVDTNRGLGSLISALHFNLIPNNA